MNLAPRIEVGEQAPIRLLTIKSTSSGPGRQRGEQQAFAATGRPNQQQMFLREQGGQRQVDLPIPINQGGPEFAARGGNLLPPIHPARQDEEKE